MPGKDENERPKNRPNHYENIISNLPAGNPHFIGRTEHLQTLAKTLKGPTTITQAIAGLGGVGKSQLMLHFAHKHRHDYDIIWWVRVDEALAEDFLALGRALGLDVAGLPQEAAMQVVRNWLNGTARRWLLLCDNADETEPRDLRQALPSGANGRILITSRNSGWQSVAEIIRLDVFSEREAAVFWTERLGYGDEAARVELAEALGRLPLAMEHAAAYMGVNGLDAAGYLRLYRVRRQALWKRVVPPDDYHATVTTTWEIGFEKARQTAGAAELLNLCCFLASDDIPLGLLVEQAEVTPEALAAVLKDELALNDAIGALERYSLMERTGGMLGVHRLVQTVARDRMGEERMKKWVETAVDFLSHAYNFDPHDMTTWADCGRLMPHLAAATELANDLGHLTNQAAFLNNEAGFYLKHYGNLEGTRPYYERALAIRERVLGPEHPDTALSLNNLGGLLDSMGDLARARPYYERALAINERVLGSEHPDTARSLNNLGYLLQAMGDLAGTRPYYERALAIRERVLGPEHPDTATSLNNLGYLLQAMGDLAGARPYLERGLAIREQVLEPEHPNTATSLNNLGILLQAMGDLAGAKSYKERALAIYEKVLGPDHLWTAAGLNNLGLLLQAMGDLAGARPYHERALAIWERVLGPEHPRTATGLNNLGMLLQAMGDLAGARPYLERALAIWERVLGPEHPNTAASYWWWGIVLREEGQVQEAQDYFRRAYNIYERVLGPDHPNTKGVRSFLA
jgi:tetratricopeptide (TPR) repeat protein